MLIRASSALIVFALAGLAADCRFNADPGEFLGRSARIRHDISRNVALFGLGPARHATAPAAIAQRNFIDQEIFSRLAALGVPPASLSADEEFFRRITLDLAGRLPEPGAIRAFLADPSESKRDAAIEKLLASPEFTDRWTMWMGDLLQNTSTLVNANVNRTALGRNAFHTYIRGAVAGDKPLSDIARETIAGAGNNFEAANGAANFPVGASTSMGPVQDTYDTMLVKSASIFLGIGSYDCLLCHSGRGHLNQVSLWGTAQTRLGAHGMAAFFSRMSLAPAAARSVEVSEAGEGGYRLDTDFGNRPSRLPVGSINVVTPAYRETGATPADNNWRAAFAGNLVRDPMFARNLANRIWKQMFSLALVDPVDSLDPARLDPAHPPSAPWDLQASHPELLEKLAAQLTENGFHLRAFLKTLAQSSAYQLSSRFEGEWKDEYVSLFGRHLPRRIEGEEVHDEIGRATGVPGDYAIQGWPERVSWAIQLPEPVEPAGNPAVNAFLNTFLRGDRDTQDRSQAGSIQQQLALMNDGFVIDRLSMARSPKLRALAQIAKSEDLIDELYLTFLSRRPADAERAAGVATLAKGDRNGAIEDLAWMCINKVEFLFSY